MPSRVYTLPPYSKPRIALSRTPSPVRESADHLDAVISGVELIVSKLPRDTITSAERSLRATFGEFELERQQDTEPLVPVRIVPGDERNPVDYVFVSVDPDVTQEPRPDLLDKVRTFLVSKGLQAEWKVAKGPDRTRRVHFQADSFAQAEALHPKLSTHLNSRGCPFQCSFVSKAMSRVTFDLLHHASIDNLLKAPPVIDHQTFYPSLPRYIQPIYAMEVAVLGVKDVTGTLSAINRYIRSSYGDVIASSRLALNGDAYCVVFDDWNHTSSFLADPFTAFQSGFGISHSVSQSAPALLYVLNSSGLPYSGRPPDSSGPAVRQLQAQFDLLQQRVDSGARAVEAVLTQQEHLAQQTLDIANKSATSIAALSTTLTSSVCLQDARSRLDNLRTESRQAHLLLAIAPPDRAPQILDSIRNLDAEVATQSAEVDRARHTFFAAQRLVPALTPPSFPSLPAPTPQLASDNHALRTRTADDLDTDMADQERRQRPRTDAGPSPTHEDQIEVDAVISPPTSSSPVHSFAFPAGSLAPSLSPLSRFFSVFLSTPGILRVFSRSPVLVFLLLALPFFIHPVFAAAPPHNGLTLFSLNANGLHDVMKTNAIKQHILSTRPHMYVINETKSSSPVASRLFMPGYNTFESTTLRTSSRSSKWGVIAAVRRDLHCQRVPTPDGLAGRAVVVDIAIPTTSARGFILRVIAVYAPWDPGGPQPTPQQFWEMVTPICQAAPSHAWCLLGDCNLTLHSIESSSPSTHPSPNHAPYLDFLRHSDGQDLWLSHEDRSALTHYTFSRGTSRSILDRVAHSRAGVLNGSVDVAPVYISATDHRPISATLMLALPGLGNANFIPPDAPQPRRFRYPSRETRDTLANFAALVDKMVTEHHLSDFRVHNDTSFDALYDLLTHILLSAASSAFQTPSLPNMSPRLRNQTIRLIVREGHRLGRLIFAAKTGPSAVAQLHARCPWVSAYLTAFHALPHTAAPSANRPAVQQQPLLGFLVHIRKTLNKLRYRAERAEAAALETRHATARINRVLLGGSSKVLYPSLVYSSPPLALTSTNDPSQLLTHQENVNHLIWS